MIYNSLILPHFNYSLLAWGCKCQNIEILQKKAIRIVHFKSPIAHTEPSLKVMSQLKLSDMYTTTHATFLSFITNCIETDYPHISKILFQSMANRTTIYGTVTFIYLMFDVSLVN